MSAQSPETPGRPFTGWHMLALICAFFGVVIAVNVTMAVFASGSWTGLVVKNSYVASQQYNEVLRDARTQGELGWKSTLAYEDGRLRFDLDTREGAAVAGAEVTAALSRPIGVERDHSLVLAEREPGLYEQSNALEPGIWNVEVMARAEGGTSYRQLFRLYIPEAR